MAWTRIWLCGDGVSGTHETDPCRPASTSVRAQPRGERWSRGLNYSKPHRRTNRDWDEQIPVCIPVTVCTSVYPRDGGQLGWALTNKQLCEQSEVEQTSGIFINIKPQAIIIWLYTSIFPLIKGFTLPWSGWILTETHSTVLLNFSQQRTWTVLIMPAINHLNPLLFSSTPSRLIWKDCNCF